MSANTTKPQGTLVPTLRYYNVAAAIDWLCKAFGFEKHLVMHTDDGSVRYAELIFGNSMVMLGPVEGSDLGEVMAQPADTGRMETQICYLFVTDAAAHCDRAKAAGAEILLGIDDVHSNGRGYSCRDFEGHVWNFGTYDPWRRQLAQRTGASRRFAERGGKLRRCAMATASLIAATAAVVMLGRVPGVSNMCDLGPRSDATTSVGEAVAGALVQPDLFAGERKATSRGFSAASDHLARERDEREVAVAEEHLANSSGDTLARAETERALEDAQQQLARERSARVEAQRGAQEARERLSLAERAIEAVQEQLAAERNARLTAEIATQEASQKLAKEHGAKQAAERALKETHLWARHAAARTPPAQARSLSASPPSPI